LLRLSFIDRNLIVRIMISIPIILIWTVWFVRWRWTVVEGELEEIPPLVLDDNFVYISRLGVTTFLLTVEGVLWWLLPVRVAPTTGLTLNIIEITYIFRRGPRRGVVTR
jgi:hypothetical protein